MKRGKYELNKSFPRLFDKEPFKDPGEDNMKAKMAGKEKFLDESKRGFRFSHPARKSSTPGDKFAFMDKTVPAAMGTGGEYGAWCLFVSQGRC